MPILKYVVTFFTFFLSPLSPPLPSSSSKNVPWIRCCIKWVCIRKKGKYKDKGIYDEIKSVTLWTTPCVRKENKNFSDAKKKFPFLHLVENRNWKMTRIRPFLSCMRNICQCCLRRSSVSLRTSILSTDPSSTIASTWIYHSLARTLYPKSSL